MTTRIIYADLHLFGPHAVEDCLVDQLFEDVKKYPAGTVVLLGDIIDFKNCRYKDLPAAHSLYARLKFAVQKRYYIEGNHECNKQFTFYLRYLNTLFEHGHMADWDPKKVEKWYHKEPGCSSRKWWMMRAVKWVRPLVSKVMSKKFTDKCINRMMIYTDVVRYICGHKHYNTVQRFSKICSDGIRREVICVPRGRSIIALED